MFYILGMTNADPFVVQTGPQKIELNPLKHISLEIRRKRKVGMVLGQNLGQIRSNVAKKQRNRH